MSVGIERMMSIEDRYIPHDSTCISSHDDVKLGCTILS